ncbi:sialate O-acetylesterase [Sphingobacterium pedocola]|uniref:sialate O-acetylesterase n=1 Tax=Sphingobacterium pedocola TaxID=2082722 RepID=UPI0018CB9660|nr:sialate O-acetylesterase [Sphingobacterium pedocola]
MVLQQDTSVLIWGWSGVGDTIRIAVSWDQETAMAVADAEGKWQCYINTEKSDGEAHTLRLSNASEEISISNILLGEVWLASGQSNMDFPMSKGATWRSGELHEAEALRDAHYPSIRFFRVKQSISDTARMDCEGEWVICNANSIQDKSAIGFYFSRELHQHLQVPVGLIQSTWGGTPVEAWTAGEIMKGNPLYAGFQQSEVGRSTDNKSSAVLWNAMIHPLNQYAIKGVIWYQGESNVKRQDAYAEMFANMIRNWRDHRRNNALPFYFVQLAPYKGTTPEIREAQYLVAEKLDQVLMASTTDVGDSTDIHPRNKRIPAERLAKIALGNLYGESTVWMGPTYLSHEVLPKQIQVTFEAHDPQGLQQAEGISGFEVAGADRIFYTATVKVTGMNIVQLSSESVDRPQYFRYSWKNYNKATLYNVGGIPALPFKND